MEFWKPMGTTEPSWIVWNELIWYWESHTRVTWICFLHCFSNETTFRLLKNRKTPSRFPQLKGTGTVDEKWKRSIIFRWFNLSGIKYPGLLLQYIHLYSRFSLCHCHWMHDDLWKKLILFELHTWNTSYELFVVEEPCVGIEMESCLRLATGERDTSKRVKRMHKGLVTSTI